MRGDDPQPDGMFSYVSMEARIPVKDRSGLRIVTAEAMSRAARRFGPVRSLQSSHADDDIDDPRRRVELGVRRDKFWVREP